MSTLPSNVVSLEAHRRTTPPPEKPWWDVTPERLTAAEHQRRIAEVMTRLMTLVQDPDKFQTIEGLVRTL